ncbi:fused MFS/spermidine synthase [Phytomonospora sp. NPDC050363]|uniref:spermidine synthase n=1 Tax=Phytomonospora sp. NPDC050363 TaxID=3155642 RepID=UPI0033FBF258
MDAIFAEVDGGQAELVPDPGREGSWTLYVASVAQSYVDMTAPKRLEFEYVRKVARILDAVGKPGEPIRVLHLGAGALTIPRYVAASRPGSEQEVVDRDGRLLDFVLVHLPLRRAARVRPVVADARDAVEAAEDGAWDVVIGDIYNGAQMPAHVSGVEFARSVARILAPGGVYALNVTDLPMLTFTRRLTAGLREVFDDVMLLGEPGMLRGRRYGNLVLAAAVDELPAGLAAAGGKGVVHGPALAKFVAGARPLSDEAPEASPG